MNNFFLFPIFAFSFYENESEYYNLSEDEKLNMDYFDECLYDSDERFSEACFNIMMMVLDLSSKINTDEEPTALEIEQKKKSILDDFNDDDKKRLESFIYVCIKNMGIYSDESIQMRKLKNERK